MTIITKQILATPVKIVAVEQTFNARGEYLGPNPSSMSLDSVEAQACLDDWTKATLRQ